MKFVLLILGPGYHRMIDSLLKLLQTKFCKKKSSINWRSCIGILYALFIALLDRMKCDIGILDIRDIETQIRVMQVAKTKLEDRKKNKSKI